MTTALITGVGRGIGKQLAQNCLAAGWKVYGSVRNPSLARQLQDELGDAFQPLVFDVKDADAVAAAASSVTEPLDVLVNNAGVIGPERQSTLDMDFDGFVETLEINSVAPLRVSLAFLPHLKNSDAARILTISSQMGSITVLKSDRIAYRASKAAVNKVMQGLAQDLEGEKIAVLLAHPGWVQTDMGGQAADITVRESADGLFQLIADYDMKKTGRFFNWSGEDRPW